MRIYLAGPIRGVPGYEAVFNKVAKRLRAGGHEVFNPAEQDIVQFGKKADGTAHDEAGIAKALKLTPLAFRRAVFKVDTGWICEYAEALAVLPGWQKSRGARAERALAIALDLPVHRIPKDWVD